MSHLYRVCSYKTGVYANWNLVKSTDTKVLLTELMLNEIKSVTLRKPTITGLKLLK